ncbi:MAG: aldehyde ferredoxin oxidoreductase family protein [Candidatus Asgardarchaeia archaeon]
MFGWTGKSAYIDLSTNKIKVIDTDSTLVKNYLGGSGVGIKLLFDRAPPKIPPFSPMNPLIFATGPLTASRVFGTGRHSVITKSPLTGFVGDATSGGFFGAYMKKAGFDYIFIIGVSNSPIYLQLHDGKVKIHDASDFWGLTTKETIKELKKEYGNKSGVAAIGPAGENKVLFATVMNDEINAAGRTGVGAVMGSKNLKAIVATGDFEVKEAKSKELDEIMDKIKARMTWSPMLGRSLKEFGTSALVNLINESGIMPTKNFEYGSFEYAENISGESLKDTILVSRRSCYNCPIACKRVTRTKNASGEGPEYESIVNLGSMLLIKDIQEVAELNYLCNEMGLDTISMGGTLATYLELSEQGKVKEKVDWGDYEAIKQLIIDTAFRRGIGNDLAEGSKRLSKKYGAPEVSVNVKGLEVPAYDPRGAFGMALSYATSYRGACHLRSWTIAFEIIGVPHLIDRFSIVEKPSLVKYTQDLSAVYDSLVMCKHYAIEFDEDYIALLLSSVTGVDFSKERVLLIGERIWNLARLFNLREGLTRKDDSLPPKLRKPLKEGPAAGKEIPFEVMLDTYYQVRGWTKEGIPTKDKLNELGLGKEGEEIG